MKSWGNYASETVSGMLCKYGGGKVREITENWATLCKDEGESLVVLSCLLEGWKTRSGCFIESGLVEYYLKIGFGALEHKERGPVLTGLRILSTLLVYFRRHFDLKGELVKRILNAFKDKSAQGSLVLRSSVVIELFRLLLEFFYSTDNEYVLVVYKSLTLVYLENIRVNSLRELMSYNFCQILLEIKSLPVDPVVEVVSKQKEVLAEHLNMFDIELLMAISRHPNLGLESAIKCVDALAKFYEELPIYSKCLGTEIILISSRNIEKQAMKEYLLKYIEFLVRRTKPVKQGKQGASVPQMDAKSLALFKRSLVYSLLQKLIQLNSSLNSDIQKMLLSENNRSKQQATYDSPGILKLLSHLGDPLDLIQQYENSILKKTNPCEVVSNRVAVNHGSQLNSKVIQDIEDTRKRRILSLEAKERESQILKTQSEKLLLTSRRELDRRKIQLGLSSIQLVIQKQQVPHLLQCDYIELKDEPIEEQELFYKMTKKYCKPLRYYFSTCQKPSRVSEDCMDFSRLLSFLRDKKVPPGLLAREELLWYVREWAKREESAKGSWNSISYDGFISILFQISV